MGILDLTIGQLGPKGDGISRGPHGRIYVDRALPGDRIHAGPLRSDDGLARAEILKILVPSPHRQKPPCAHYDRCGSCTLQHLDPDYYRRWKIQMVTESLARYGLEPREWLKPVFIGSGNRRRATFSVRRQRDQLVMGYYRRRSREIGDIDSCLVADPKILALRAKIKPLLKPLLAEGRTIDVFFQLVGEQVDMVITGRIGRGGKPDAASRTTLSGMAQVLSITRVGWRDTESMPVLSLVDRGRVSAKFGMLNVELPPASFLQPTSEGEGALIDAVLGALPAKGTFADLFSGCGTFSGPMLERGSVDAYESLPAQVRALSKAAEKQGALKVFRRDLFAAPLRRDELNRYDAIVFDPPRAGCREQAEAMASSRAPLLIGVSCNPATFSRDARILCDGGYRFQSLRIVDQFLWSHHVELVGVFTKRRRFR